MTNTVATIHENNEKNTAHAAVMEVLVNLKKTVVSISLDSPEQIVSLYQVALTCKDKLIELYFHYSDELQYDLSVNVDKKDDDDIRKV
ncbi:hypothetical protein KBC03_03180 [Patescibacteria group bacterium]|nr:hypothetical protein [Patescibacteria group bacterium]